MKPKLPKLSLGSAAFSDVRRRLLGGLLAAGGVGASLGAGRARAEEGGESLRFPGDPAEHKLLYQFNKADPGYHEHVLFSIGSVLRKYNDNVDLVVVCFAEGIHVLGKRPLRPVSPDVQQRIASLNHYGVKFHACGNTMKSLNWTADDLVPFAEVVDVGAADIMELQEQGYAYISW